MMRKQLVKSIEKPRKFIKYKQGYLTILWMKNETGRDRSGLMEKRQDNLRYIFISDRKASELELCYPAIKPSNLPSELLPPPSQCFVKTDESWYTYSS